MSSVRHKTTYEEVAIEQGEINKQQSSNTMVQSKFIYMAFAIVFTVILIQGIVLYIVLKPSASTENIQAENFIPIGFVYTQFPKEKAPSEIWPWMKWTDVSSAYSGVVFRVFGGEAAAFGQVQSENAPQLSTVEYKSGQNADKIQLSSGQCGLVSTAGYHGPWTSLQFCMSSGEVRPRNMAVHIWKRTG